MEYVWRFVRLASRYEEDVLGTTTVGYPGVSFTEGPGDSSHLGSGIDFLDDAAGSREVIANTSRIEGWRRTAMYRMRQEVIEHKPVKLCITLIRLTFGHYRTSNAVLKAVLSGGLTSTINSGDCGT